MLAPLWRTSGPATAVSPPPRGKAVVLFPVTEVESISSVPLNPQSPIASGSCFHGTANPPPPSALSVVRNPSHLFHKRFILKLEIITFLEEAEFLCLSVGQLLGSIWMVAKIAVPGAGLVPSAGSSFQHRARAERREFWKRPCTHPSRSLFLEGD